MNESFAALEEMIRELADDANPATSLRQRILIASHNSRVKQLRRVRILRTAGWTLTSLCLIYVGILVQGSFRQLLDSPHDYEHSVARGDAMENSHDLMSDSTTAIASQMEASTSHFSDPIEWATAESHRKRRDRQSALISRYF